MNSNHEKKLSNEFVESVADKEQSILTDSNSFSMLSEATEDNELDWAKTNYWICCTAQNCDET